MKLRDYVNEKVENGVIFNIGNAGSGWIFCGTKEEFKKNFNLVSEDYHDNYKRRYNESMKSIEVTTIKGSKRKQVFVKGSNKKDYEPEDIWKARIMKAIDELPKIIEHKFFTYKKNKEKYLTFVPFQDRSVKRVYYTDISNTLCIEIEGRDTGIFWSHDEFVKIYHDGKRTRNKAVWLRENDEELEDDDIMEEEY